MSHSGETSGPLLIFYASGFDGAFALEAVQEVVPMAALFSPPGTPPGIAGFLDLRGQAIPILRWDRLFDLPEQRPGLHTPLLILRAAESCFGLLAEAVRRIALPAADCWLPRDTPHAFHECAAGAFLCDGRVTHLLAADALLSQHERGLVTAMQAAAQARMRLLEATP